ncbi:MAG: hypothetical protein EBU28_01050 [Gammaproteobacteria bacterium]|nr:hypothetical protein [Gammaproteobacteria bacterium]
MLKQNASLFSRQAMRWLATAWLVSSLFCFPFALKADPFAQVLAPFSSEYAVDYSGFNAVRSVALEVDGNEYSLRTVLTLKGVARLSGYGPVYEESRFRPITSSYP